ncbi:MAG: PIG-L family deacetylase [Candidatus Hydrogenedentes bacterium]|nr:PIG-L family deacetylase [Candidatus Hydrogenedentota bacterium]
MQFSCKEAELYIPDGVEESAALARTTHLAIGAHQDDLEIMACEGILTCFQQPDLWYTGVVVTNGSGSPRSDVYANYSDDEMVKIRRKEQKKAALIGDFAAQFLLDFPSGAVKSPTDDAPINDLVRILEATRPKILYTHNLADKHDTHIGVTMKVLHALRRLEPEARPEKVYGCEVWRDLDWMVDTDKIAFDVSARENLQFALLGVFDSQIAGGKRYDLSTMGRRRAHATYHQSHGVDETTGITFGMDLTPLMAADPFDPVAFVQHYINRFHEDVTDRVARIAGNG